MTLELEKRGLTPVEVDLFHKQGFVGPYTAFSPEVAAKYLKIIREDVLSTPTPHSLYNNQTRHLDSVSAWTLCSEPSLVANLQSLYGQDLMVWLSTVFDKAPAVENNLREYPWHQDTWFWKLYPMFSLGVWLALTPATIENGCVDLIAGTHLKDIPPVKDTDKNHDSWFHGRKADPNYFDESKKCPMILEAGQYFIFAERTLHHSNPNLTDQNRTGISFRVTLPMVKADHDHACVMLSGQDNIGINKFVLPPTSDPKKVISYDDLPEAREFNFDEPVTGLGWHNKEMMDGKNFRWTGPETVSSVEMKLEDVIDSVLSCTIACAITGDVLQSLTIKVNEIAVDLSWQSEGTGVKVTANVAENILATNAPRVKISFAVLKSVRPCDVNPDTMDTRHVGIAISQISLKPMVTNAV